MTQLSESFRNFMNAYINAEIFCRCITLEVTYKDSKMSTKIKLSNGSGSQFRNHNEAITHCPDNSISSGSTKENNHVKHVPKSKYYRCLFDYCSEVADKLPQRQAFYAVDLEDILWKVQEWKKCLPNVEIFYAVKANTDPILLQLLTKLGLSFDCATSGEIKMVLEAGASPKNIIFAHTIKTVEELKLASDKGVELMTFDNEDELMKIHRVYPNANMPSMETFLVSEKFGCTKDDAVKLLKLARQLNLNIIGISFHVGSLCTDPISYVSTIEISRRLFDVARDLGFAFSIIDIGGGFFGASDTQHIFYKMADNIQKALEEHFPGNQVRVIAEPGTYIVDSAFNLVCTVLGRRCLDNSAEGKPKRHYFLNDSVYGNFNSHLNLYGMEIPIPLLDEPEVQSRSQYDSRLYGQTCCAVDVIMDNVVLPDLKIGERVTWCNMGAYCQGVISTFCGVPIPVARYVFVQKQRLNMDGLTAQTTITDFLKKHVSFIKCTDDDI